MELLRIFPRQISFICACVLFSCSVCGAGETALPRIDVKAAVPVSGSVVYQLISDWTVRSSRERAEFTDEEVAQEIRRELWSIEAEMRRRCLNQVQDQRERDRADVEACRVLARGQTAPDHCIQTEYEKLKATGRAQIECRSQKYSYGILSARVSSRVLAQRREAVVQNGLLDTHSELVQKALKEFRGPDELSAKGKKVKKPLRSRAKKSGQKAVAGVSVATQQQLKDSMILYFVVGAQNRSFETVAAPVAE